MLNKVNNFIVTFLSTLVAVTISALVLLVILAIVIAVLVRRKCKTFISDKCLKPGNGADFSSAYTVRMYQHMI